MVKITFHMNVKGYGRTVIAERVRRGDNIVYNWMKPYYVIDALRKDPRALVEQEGDHIMLADFGKLAELTDRSEKEQANTCRKNDALIGWLAAEWSAFRSTAQNTLGWMSDGNVLDYARAAQRNGLRLYYREGLRLF